MAPRVAVLVTSRPCLRRALTIGRQRSPTDNHVHADALTGRGDYQTFIGIAGCWAYYY